MTPPPDEVDYTKCPGPEHCPITEYKVQGQGMGMNYGCMGAKGSMAFWSRPWSAWLCLPAWKAGEEAKVNPDPVMVRRTMKFRNSLRGTQIRPMSAREPGED